MPTTEPAMPKAVLCGPPGVAKLLSIDVPGVLRELDAGRLPAPILVDGEMRWRIKELRDWVETGMPDRAVWERTVHEKALPTKKKPARKAPLPDTRTPTPAANGRRYDNFKIPKPGKSVFAWCKAMEKALGTKLVEGMGRDGEAEGCGRQFADWNEEQVRAICLKVIGYLRTLPQYAGQYEYLFDGGSAEPPWTLA